MNKFLKILAWVLTIAAIACLWYFTHKDHVEHPLKGLELNLIRQNEHGFIDKNVECQKIMKICDTVHNTDITMIPIDSVRNYLKSIPWAIYTDANITFDEIMVVNIIECQPIMRIFYKDGHSVYLDEDGNVYPSKYGYSAHLMIGSGNITKNNLPNVFKVMKKVLNNSYSKCCVKQVYFDGKNYELVLNNVDLTVILGNDENVDEKLMNMQYFFEQMQGSPELKNFSKINFNFENQVVCTKNKNKR